MDPQTGLTLVTLPPPVSFNAVQNSHTQQVLDNLGEGLDVGVLGPLVYSQRRGGTHAFWSRCKFDRSKTPQEVAKTEPQVLFLFRDFLGGERPLLTGLAISL